MSRDSVTDRPPPPRPRARVGSKPAIEELAFPAHQARRGFDDPRMVAELERLEADRAAALARAQDALEIAQAAREHAEQASAAARRVASERPTKSQWASLVYKLVAAVTALIVAATVALGAWTSEQSSRIDKTQDKAASQESSTGALAARVKALEDYAAALQAHSDCVDAERDSAIERGTGHVVEGDHSQVVWVEVSAPRARARNLWPTAPWTILKSSACPPKPDPPRAPAK